MVVPDLVGGVEAGSVDMDQLDTGRATEAPAWLLGAWGSLDSSWRTAASLRAYQQGLELWDRHPSQAGVAFVAAIETIGAGIEKPTRCDVCGQHTGAGKGFRAARRTVMSDDAAEALSKMYGVRSKTAHEGALHGLESMLGLIQMPSLWRVDERYEFEMVDLWRIAAAAQRVVQQALI